MRSIHFRQLVSNLTFLITGEAISKLLTFAAFVLLARALGPQGFGHLEFTLATIVFFTLFVDFGTSSYGAREVAKDRNRMQGILMDIFSLRILLAVIGYALLSLFVFLLPEKQEAAKPLILIYGLTLFGIPAFLQWIFQGLDEMKWVAMGSVLRQSIFAVGMFLLIPISHELLKVGFIECAAVAGFVAYCIYIFKKRLGSFPKYQFNLKSIKATFIQTLPIGLSELTWASTWYFPTILIGLLIGGNDVGWFSAALRPVMTLHTFVWLYFYNMLPSMSRYSKEPPELLQNFMRHSIRITAWSAVFIGMLGMILAGPVITAVFGSSYSFSVLPFRILIWMVPIALLSGHYRYILIAFNLQKYEFVTSICTAMASIVLSALLIPRWGAVGGAAALVSSALLNGMLAYEFVRRKIILIPFTMHLVKPLIAGVMIIPIFLLIGPFYPWVCGAIAVLIFAFVLFLLQPEIRRTGV